MRQPKSVFCREKDSGHNVSHPALMAALSRAMDNKSLPEFMQQLWRKHLPNTLQRLETVERAVAGLLAGELSDAALQEAIRESHKLAGSLGSYGLPQASESARKTEFLLESGNFSGDVPMELSEEIVKIRRWIEQGPAETRETSPVPSPSPAPDQPAIVLVEDDAMLRELLVHAFGLQNFAVKAYAEGDSAFADLTSDRPIRPKLLILDIDLPGTSGMTILRELSQRGLTRTMRVLMLTARNSEAEVINSLKLGAIDHVSKPFSLPILLEKVHRALL